MKKFKFLIIAIALISIKANGQDVHFSQFQNTPMLINPANAGAVGDMRVYVNYRDQWRSVTTPFKTIMASFETRFLAHKTGKSKLTAAGYIYSDKAGDTGFGNTVFNLTTSYRLPINEHNYFTAGISGGVQQRSLSNSANFRWDNQYNGISYDGTITPTEIVNLSSSTQGDFGGGLTWIYSKNSKTLSSSDARFLSVGLATYHVNQPKLFTDGKFLRSVLSTYGYYGINNTPFILNPAAYVFLNNKSKEIMFGTNIKYVLKEDSKYTNMVKGAAVMVGVFHRLNDAVILNVGLEQGNYGVYFSYDINTSQLTGANGGFEISLRFINPNPFRGTKSGGNARFL